MTLLVILVPVCVFGMIALVVVLAGWRLDTIAHRFVMKDHTIKDQLSEFPDLIAKSKGIIRIATDFEHAVFDAPAIQTAFAKALDGGAEIRFLTDAEPTKHPLWYRERATARGKVQIKVVPRLSRHIVVFDAQTVRVEKPHPGRRFGSIKGDIGFIFVGFSELAERYTQEFDQEFNRSWN
jgi:hypothetical protein